VRALLDVGEDPSVPYKGKPIVNLMLMSGATALVFAAFSGSAACVELLLRHRASLDARAGPVGGTPLMLAAGLSEDAVRALAEGSAAAGVPLNVHAEALLNKASALNLATFVGTPGSVAALLELGADISHVNEHGGHVWTDACANPRADVATLELIKSHAGVSNINMQFQPRTAKWMAIDLMCESLERAGCGKRELVRDLANTRGATPLHYAAMTGRLDLVRWLLENGAEPSVAVRNARGRTPLQLSQFFGPHLAVEAELVGYEQRRAKRKIFQFLQNRVERISFQFTLPKPTQLSQRESRLFTSARDSSRDSERQVV